MKTPLERFLRSVDKSPGFGPNGDCWRWTGRLEAGYGRLRMGSKASDKKVGAHKAAWLLLRGDVPAVAYVCHKCDNPSCVNPDHLFLGTALSNMQDKVQKGRHRSPVGEAHGTAVLTDAQAAAARALYWDFPLTYRQVGAAFSVGYGVIGALVRRETWRHV
jgi:hypothetical protein